MAPSLTALWRLGLDGSPGVSRTPDLRFRKPLLYPSELRGLLQRNLIFSRKQTTYQFSELRGASLDTLKQLKDTRAACRVSPPSR
jgi:hypothetical protein